jgi:hypothetical protein
VLVAPGNHDIGYAGDITPERVERFERAFGPVNGDVILRLPRAANDTSDQDPPAIRLVVLNGMNLDGPAHDYDLQRDTYLFTNAVMDSLEAVGSRRTALVLLTHVPLHKEAGVCADAPFFSHHRAGDEADGEALRGAVREQNMLSPERSRDAVLQGLFGMHPSEAAPARGLGRAGVVLTGHDHVGCDVYHHADRGEQAWRAQRWADANTSALVADADRPGLREVTVRSMMGEYGGNAALVAAWWDEEEGRWSIEVANCMLGVQHVWWSIHILDFVAFLVIVAGRLSTLLPARVSAKQKPKAEKKVTGRPASKGRKS